VKETRLREGAFNLLKFALIPKKEVKSASNVWAPLSLWAYVLVGFVLWTFVRIAIF